VTLRFVASGDAQLPRVAFTTVRTGAVTRNRIRRRLRAAVATQPALTPGAYLFGGGPEVATAPFSTLVDAVARLAAEVDGAGAPA
jgi:ribonuclease P protein component